MRWSNLIQIHFPNMVSEQCHWKYGNLATNELMTVLPFVGREVINFTVMFRFEYI